jgi:hypothetical protein
MKLSGDYDDFISKLGKTHPRYGENYELPFEGSQAFGLRRLVTWDTEDGQSASLSRARSSPPASATMVA